MQLGYWIKSRVPQIMEKRLKLVFTAFLLLSLIGATVNGGNGNGGNGNGKGSSKLPATIVVQLKMEEIYGWYGP